MKVKDLITRLLDFDMNEDIYVSLDEKEKIGHINTIEDWHGMAIIHFENWIKSGKTCDTCRNRLALSTVCLECEYDGPAQGFSRYEPVAPIENVEGSE